MECKLLRGALPWLTVVALLCIAIAPSANAQRPTLLAFSDTPCDSLNCGAIVFENPNSVVERIISLTMRDSTSFGVTPPVMLPIAIEPGERSSLPICFAPSRRGVITDSLRAIIQRGGVFDTVNVRITGRGIGPDLAVSPSVLNFPLTNVGGSTRLTITITNNGERPFTLTSASLVIPAPFRVVTPLPQTVIPGGTVELELAFEPGRRGVYSEQVDLMGGCNRHIQINLNGVTDLIGIGAVLKMSKVSFNPANQEETPCGVGVCDSVIFSNVGNAMLIIDSVSWTNGGEGYTFDPPFPNPLNIPPNSQYTFRVCFERGERGTWRDTLVVRSNSRTSIAFGLMIDISKSMEIEMPCTPPTPRINEAIVQAQNFVRRTLLYLPEVNIQDQLVVQSFSSKQIKEGSNETVPVIAYPFLLVSITDASRIVAENAIGALSLLLGTPTGVASLEMIDTVSKSPIRDRVIVLLTDGRAEDESKISVPTIVSKARANGIRIFTIGLGIDSTVPGAVAYLAGLAAGTGGAAFNASICDSLQTAFETITDSVSRGTMMAEPFAMRVTAPLVIVSQDLAFDSLYVGGRRCLPITLTNVGEGDATVDTAIIGDMLWNPTGEFTFDGGVSLPITIPANGQVTLNVCFSPARIRNRAGQARFTSPGCSITFLHVGMTGTGFAAANLRIADQKIGLPGDIVRMPIYADSSLAEYGVDTISYQVRWNKSMLDLRGVYPGRAASDAAVTITTPVSFGTSSATVGLTSVGSGISGGGELAELEFQVLRGDTVLSLVELTEGRFQDGNPKITLYNPGMIAFDSTCFFNAKPIYPNGASAKVVVGDIGPMPVIDRIVTMSVNATDPTALSVEVYAGDGTLVLPPSDRRVDRGESRISLDISMLGSGSYYALLSTSAGETIIRKFLVVR